MGFWFTFSSCACLPGNKRPSKATYKAIASVYNEEIDFARIVRSVLHRGDWRPDHYRQTRGYHQTDSQEVISVRQIKADVDRLEKASGLKFTAEQIKQVLDARINSLLFVQFCEREKITVSDADVNNALARMKSGLGAKTTDAELENSLRSSGVFVEPKVYVRQRLLFETYVQTKRAAELKAALTPPTADDILKAYDLAKASLVRPDTMRVSVLYADTRGISDADAKKAKDTIQAVAAASQGESLEIRRIPPQGRDAAGYKAIPSLYMEKTAQNKTLFGDDLFDSVFKLKVGDISPVIESPTGYRIVRSNEFPCPETAGSRRSRAGEPERHRSAVHHLPGFQRQGGEVHGQAGNRSHPKTQVGCLHQDLRRKSQMVEEGADGITSQS